MKFIELLNNKNIAAGLERQNISEPTKVQIEMYKPMMDNQNIVARSETGSGKTLAYLIPLYEKIDPQSKDLYSIILVPTYELSMQVTKQIELLSFNSGISIRTVSLIGNGNITRQIEQLKNKPQIVVGTAGRILELFHKKKLSAHTVKTLIIDEADKMMDKNNLQPLLDVKKCLYKSTQIVMCSASMNDKNYEKAKGIVSNPVIIKSKTKEQIPENIEHLYIITSRREKIETLRSLCSAIKPNKCMIFINTRFDSEKAYEKLLYHHYKVYTLSKDQDKVQRKNALTQFKNGQSNYMISTDIASRGLHIDNIDTVINVTLPADSRDYLHRAGRCGRNNQKGICISIITDNELNKITELEKIFKIKFKSIKISNGKIIYN